MLTDVMGFSTSHPIGMVCCIPLICETLQDVQITNDYLNRPTGKSHEFLNPDLFSKILKHHSIKKNISVQECANHWKNIIEEAFNDCRNAIKIIHQKDHSVVRISPAQFSKYMTDNIHESNIVDNIVHELYPRQNLALCWIDSRIFKELFMNYCRKFNLSVKEVAEVRKERTPERIKKGIEVINNAIKDKKNKEKIYPD
ncbi:uncharacterized protein LOC126847312 isoform X2 [Adelges cooleyi]|uniref:uncharacterized protein LOC126847312 isoform X2 n=1 Tax=Adelges cooleyi TaxID=133065 RepID=UPI0021808DF4|nr:uncharacterized protein LOC126847312 isoform X2 [Adelges cooleyi]